MVVETHDFLLKTLTDDLLVVEVDFSSNATVKNIQGLNVSEVQKEYMSTCAGKH